MGAETKLPHFHSGKVRESKLVPGFAHLLLPIATNRFSTHNVVHKTEIPGKGELLTAMVIFWVMRLLDPEGFKHHVVAWGRKIYDYLPKDEYDPRLHYRALIVQRLEMILVEFVWRNYLTGSLETAYRKGRDPYGLHLPEGLRKMAMFDVPQFTPTDKSETDEPLVSSEVSDLEEEAFKITLRIFMRMTEILRSRNITLIDSKMEVAKGGVLADEFGTGDCSRMAWSKDIVQGQDPPWLDKEIGRQIALRKWGDGPRVPLEFDNSEITKILDGYHEAFEGVTGKTLAEFQKEYFD